MNSKIELSNLKLISASFEIRYDNAYLLWDRSGFVWSTIKSIYPNIEPQHAEPNLSNFVLDDRFQFSVKIDRVAVIDQTPKSSLNDFMEIADGFTKSVVECLEISEYTRLGLRLVYNKFFPNRESAANFLIESGMMVVPEGKHFNIEGKVFFPQYGLAWEDDNFGLNTKLKVQNRKVELKVPSGIEEVAPFNIEKPEFQYDIDYYTLNRIKKGQLNVNEWINQIYHLIKRDSSIFLGR